MSADELTRKVRHWMARLGCCGHLGVEHLDDCYIVWFEKVTTKARASSMVTRLGLLVQEIAGPNREAIAGKILASPMSPVSRDDLKAWRIFARIPIRKRAPVLQFPSTSVDMLRKEEKVL